MGATAFALVASAATPVLAADSQSASSTVNAISAVPTTDAASSAPPYWSRGNSRIFAAGRGTAGLGYARLALALGYGQPHWIWVGAEASGYVSPLFGLGQVGLHASAVVIDGMVAVRRTRSFEYGRMAAAPSVSHSDLAQTIDKVTYDSLDASVWGFVPYRDLLINWELTARRAFGLDDSLVFEEIERVVVGKDGLFAAKLSPMVRISNSGWHYVGVLAEELTLLGRTSNPVLRLGPSVWGRLGDHWSYFGCFTVPIHSPDRLGWWVGSFGYLGVTYAFATDDHAEVVP